MLYSWLENEVGLVEFEQGKITLNISSTVPPDFTKRVSFMLEKWTGLPWKIITSEELGNVSLSEQKNLAKEKEKDDISKIPEIKKILDSFPGAKIIDIS